MARGKKKESALTQEEKLAQVLVPDWEWPYKVPKNWCWVKLSALSDLISKGTTPTGGKNAYVSEGVHFLRVENINDDGTISHDNIACVTEEMHTGFLKRSVLHSRDVLVSIAGTLGKTGIVRDVDLPLNTNQAVAFVRLKSEAVNERYIKGVIDNPITQELLLGKTKVTSIPNLTLEIIGDCPIPLAPIAEQQRIVERVEYLFSKLDEAKEKAQSVLDSFETRKAAILHKAFTGELTAKWREEHGVGMDSWNNTSLAQVVSGFKYGTSEKSDYNNTGMPVLRIPNIGDGCVDFSDIKYLNHSDIDEESQIHEGDILIIRSNGSRDLVGKSVLVPKLDRPHAYASFLIRIKPSAIVKANYLTLYLNSADARSQMFRKAKSSAGINNINSKELGAISLTLPSISEQMEIVRILDSLFSREQLAKEAAEAVLEKIDLLKKSILSRAFRGELGTNDPTEESALELLKQVLQEDAPAAPKKRSKSVPKELQAKLATELEHKIVKLYFKQETDSLPAEELLSVSSKKFEVMNSLHNLEHHGILKKLPNGNYRLLE